MTTSADNAARAPARDIAQTLSLDNSRLFAALLVVVIAPLWIGSYLPLVDLPQHAAQIASLRQLWGGDAALGELFRVNLFTPYLLGYVLLYVLALVVPITTATKIVVSAALVAIPLLTGRLLRAAGADERWKWLAVPCSFGFAFYWGFLPFFVAAPLALLFLIQTIRFVDQPTVQRAVGIAIFATVLFFCHVIVLGFAALIALGYVLGRHYRDVRRLLLLAIPYLAPLPLIAIWLLVTYESETRVQSDPVVFGPFDHRLFQLLIQPAGRDDLAGAALPIVLLVDAAVLFLPWLSGARLTRRPERWMPLLLALCVFMATPHYVLSAAYFYQRLGLFLVPLWLLVWEKPTRARRFDWLAMPIVALWAVMNAGRFAAFARETENLTAMLDDMEPRRRAAALIYDHASPLFSLPVYLHFPVWYQATKGGIVDFSFADFYSQVLRYRSDAGPRLGENVGWYPTTFEWAADGGDSYDYFVVKSNVDVAAEIFKADIERVELVARHDWWWLYRNLERAR